MNKADDIINLANSLTEQEADEIAVLLRSTYEGMRAWKFIKGTISPEDFNVPILPFPFPKIELAGACNTSNTDGLYTIGNLQVKLNTENPEFLKYNPKIFLYTRTRYTRYIKPTGSPYFFYLKKNKWGHEKNEQIQGNRPKLPNGRKTEFAVSEINKWINIPIDVWEWFTFRTSLIDKTAMIPNDTIIYIKSKTSRIVNQNNPYKPYNLPLAFKITLAVNFGGRVYESEFSETFLCTFRPRVAEFRFTTIR